MKNRILYSNQDGAELAAEAHRNRARRVHAFCLRRPGRVIQITFGIRLFEICGWRNEPVLHRKQARNDFNDTGGAWVFTLNAAGDLAERRAVCLGRRNTNYIEVESGLLPGDLVIVSSYTNFIEVDRLFIDR